MKQDYVLKKFVKANNAAEALALDSDTAVTEVFLVENKPDTKINTVATGFRVTSVEGESE
jgi:hypothetical protein